MDVNITARHFDLTESIKEHINIEIEKLNRYFDADPQIKFILDVEKYRNKCEISLKFMGQTLVVTEETSDMYHSIDKSIDVMERNIKKLKEKVKDHKIKENNIFPEGNDKEFIDAARENSFE